MLISSASPRIVFSRSFCSFAATIVALISMIIGNAFAADADCMEKGGKVHCTPPLLVADWGYDQCDPATVAYLVHDVRWCAIRGGQWLAPNSGPYCNNPTPFSEATITPWANAYFAPGPNTCSVNLASDTLWTATINDGNGCYSGGTVIKNGVEIANFRQHSYTSVSKDGSGACTVNATGRIISTRGRTLACPAGYYSRTLVNGDLECYMTPLCEKCVGNPVDMGNGAKRQRERDYVNTAPGGLMFERSYNSHGFFTDVPRVANNTDYWRHNYSSRVQGYPGNSYILGAVVRPSGAVKYFNIGGGEIYNIDGAANRLEKLIDGGGALTGWRLITSERAVELYDAAGRLLSITPRAGVVSNLAYDGSGRLQTISDPFGRQITLAYLGASPLIYTMTDPSLKVITYNYDAGGRLQTVVYPDAKVRTYHYEDVTYKWALTGITDENSNRFATYTYGGYGWVSASTHAAGANSISIAWGTYNSPETYRITDAFGEHGFTYTTVGGVKKFTAENDGSTVVYYSFDVNGNVSSRSDSNGNVACSGYDLVRNLEIVRIEGATAQNCNTAATTLTKPLRKITTEWNLDLRSPKRVAEPLRLTSYTFFGDVGAPECPPDGAITGLVCEKKVQVTTDATGELGLGVTPTINVAARIWKWTYDQYGRVLTATDPQGNTTTNTYYANTVAQGTKRGMLNTVTNAAGHVTTITSYNAHGQPLSVTDANGLVTSMEYDLRQRLKLRTVGSETSGYDYDGVGQLIKLTLPDSSVIHYGYDGAHRLVKMSDGANIDSGNRITYTLDSKGNRINEYAYDPAGTLARKSKREMDARNRLRKSYTGADATTFGNATENSYDDNGNLKKTTDPLTRVTTQNYDSLNRLTEVIDPVNGSSAPTKYEYDAQDNLTKVIDPKNLSTIYGYNGFNELTSQVSPDTGTTSFTHYPGGNMETKTDARGVKSTYTYDALNRVKTIKYAAFSPDPEETVTYVYDTCTNGKGHLCSITDKTGTTSFSYDVRGRILSKSQAMLAIGTTPALTQTISYGYNSAGQMNSMTLPSGKVVVYTHVNNRVTGITVSGKAIVKNANYAPFGPIGEWTWGNDTIATGGSVANKHKRSFDLDGRNTMIESGINIDPAVIAYDIAGRINALQRKTGTAVDLAKSTTYGYDGLDRLDSVTPNAGNTNPARAFSYDGVGNRMSATVASSTTNYVYPPASHRLGSLTGATAKTFAYDSNGNRYADGTSTWTYGGNNRPLSISIPATTTVVQAGINALGQRVTKTVNGTVTRFMYDEAGRLIGEYDPVGKVKQETLWLNDLPVAVVK